MFDLEILELRDTPSAYVGSGLLRFDDGFELQPFEDWTGELSVLDTPDGDVWVGAGVGGGPRVAVFNPVSHERTRPDWFAGDPSSRSGIVLVKTDYPVKPSVTVGPEQPAFTVYFDFRGPYQPAYEDRVVRETATYFGNLPIRFTNVPPQAPPGSYGTVVVGAATVWKDWSTGGFAPTDTWGLPGYEGSAVSREVFVSAGSEIAAHEIGHAFGLPHKPHTLMSADSLTPGLVFDDDQMTLLGTRVH